MPIRDTESWMLRFASNHLAAERSDEQFELIGATLTDAAGVQGTGWTFTSDHGGGEAIKALLDLLLPRVADREPDDVEAINDWLFHLTHRLGHGIASMAISAIDIALWDLRARQRNVSLARLLGQVRDRVPCYGSGKASPTLTIDELVATSVEYIHDGFQAVKIRIGRDPAHDQERVRAVREAIGSDARILCDANERLDLPTALSLGRRLADQDIFWLEEPLLSQDIDGYQRLRAALPMAIAMGEHVHARRDFIPYIRAGAVDVLQPDMCLVGGITETMRIGRIADSFGLALAPHFMTPLHLHITAALPRATYLEYYPFMDHLLAEKPTLKDGMLMVPDRPGHGVGFAEQAWKQYRVA
ncbi:MAG TPA: mandelate racemase/muconate lactonizing enzyme family protein [Acetobacteraceae bacterium]